MPESEPTQEEEEEEDEEEEEEAEGGEIILMADGGGEDWDFEWGRSGVEIKEVEVKCSNKMAFELDCNVQRGKFGEAFW